MSAPSGLLMVLFLASMVTALTRAQRVQGASLSWKPLPVAGLSYEAQDTIVDLMSEEGFRGLLNAKLLARGEPRRIYRKDTGAKYVAYYEILSGDGTEYFLLSAGPKTGDNRFVESGNVTARDKRPTDVLNDQAKFNGQACSKHYRLSSAGVYICENNQGFPVAATYNWTSNAPINPKEWRSLAAMVKKDLGQFNKEWRKLSREVSEEGEWQNIQRVGSAKTEQFGEEALDPGTTHRVALGFQVKSNVKLAFKTTGGPRSDLKAADWQKRLCSVLLNACTGRDLTSLSRNTFAVAPNGLHYFLLTVHQDRSHIQTALMNTDISFTIQLKTDDGALIEKSFGIETNFTSRSKRWSSWSYWNVPLHWLFPNYNQHSCCGCYSGCGPVAWAQVFAYYDRLAHNGGYGYNMNLFRCSDDVGINWPCVAPWWTPMRYVEGIRRCVDTFCLFGGGATTHWDMTDAKLTRWYRSRQGGSAWLDSHTSWWSSLPGIYRTWIRDKAIADIKSHHPAIVGIWVGWSQHYAVATRYRRRHKRWRICWWFFGWHCTKWFYIWHHEWYLHMGWGSSGNAWRKSKAFAAFAAKK